MSVIQETFESQPAATAKPVKPSETLLNKAVRLLCSVKLGVSLLILLGLACFIGMVIMQQNVDGFERYFAQLTPSQRLVYGSWYSRYALGPMLFYLHHTNLSEEELALVCAGNLERILDA